MLDFLLELERQDVLDALFMVVFLVAVAATALFAPWVIDTCSKFIDRRLSLSMEFKMRLSVIVGSLILVISILFMIWYFINDDYPGLIAAAAAIFLMVAGIYNIIQNIKILNLPEKTFKFPNGISFNHPGRFEAKTQILGGTIHLASLEDKLRESKPYKDVPFESKASYDQRMFSQWPPSYSVNFYKNTTGQTISNMYLHEKNSSKKTLKLAKTTIAGKEALLHEEYRYDDILEGESFHRTMTVLFDDNVVTVNCVVRNKNKIDECRVIAEGIENSLKIPATIPAASASEWSFSPAASSYKPAKPQISSSENKHYLTLGLQHGATQDEIRAAFQRITEQYHPDKDASMDASMKYHEARLAYNALIKGEGSPWVSQ